MKREQMLKAAVETTNQLFQSKTDKETNRLNFTLKQFGSDNFKRKTKYNAYVNAQFNQGVYVQPKWDKL